MNAFLFSRAARLSRKLAAPFRLSALAARVIGFSKPPGNEPGLLMIQIDGLARPQLEQAIRKRKMPFLAGLISNGKFSLRSHYSGLPSSTPGVQGEIFYGVRCAVPSFGFVNHTTGESSSMLSAKAVLAVQRRLERENVSLLEGGSAYSDIYNGGTEKSGFCSPDFGLGPYLHPFNPVLVSLLVLIHAYTILRTAVLLCMELVLAIRDFAKGIIARENFWMEVRFIPARVGICVILRELITSNVAIDLSRGLPVVHCNFLGYDEQAHRRGPSSAFAHWTLKGIDDAVKRVYMAASRSNRRNYRILIYSDHGQEKTLSYPDLYGGTVQKVVGNFLREQGICNGNHSQELSVPHNHKNSSFFSQLSSRYHAFSHVTRPRVVAVGPVGHVYLPGKISDSEMDRIGALMVSRCGIPLVFRKLGNNRVKGWNKKGDFILPRDALKVFGSDHPFLESVAEDWVTLVHHDDSGDFVINGWDPDNPPLSFPRENGAHAGPGKEETHGFVLLPKDCRVNTARGYLRPMDLRKAAYNLLEKNYC